MTSLRHDKVGLSHLGIIWLVGLKLVGFIYVPMRRRKDVTKRSVSFTSFSRKCNIISNRTCLSILKHSSIPKVYTQNASSLKNDFEDFRSNFIETLKVQTELFMNQQKELLFTEMNLFKNNS